MAKRERLEDKLSLERREQSKDYIVKRTTDKRYIVSSGSQPDECYYVDPIKGCECIGYYFRKGYCAHYHRLKQYLAEKNNS